MEMYGQWTPPSDTRFQPWASCESLQASTPAEGLESRDQGEKDLAPL